jgi:putative hydroxymethylpyrimidine transporter CytX
MTTVGERAAAAEVPPTLAEPPPRTLRAVDVGALWANLGVSLLGFTGAIFVLVPLSTPMSLAAAFTALLVGTVLGALGVAAAGLPGQATGAPSMVLLRGLFGTRASYLPTVLNVVQLIGWTTFELVTIGTAMHQIADGVPRWVYIVAGGVITTLLALRPLGWIRVLRKYVTVAVVIALTYLFVQLLRHPLPSLNHGSWSGFWIAVDTVVGVSVSWVPLVSDYTRHARSARAAFVGTFAGFSLTQIACYSLGLVVLVTVAQGDPNQIFGSFMAVPLGTLAFAVLAVRELDQSFADTYSTAVSMQNFRPRWDRRALALAVGTVATICALALNIADYENFLLLIGSVFVPLLGVLIVDYFVLSRRRWDLGEDVRVRWPMLAAWGLGFVAYQLVNPGTLSWWTRGWAHVRSWLHFTPQSWMSASLLSFIVAAVATALIGALAGEGRMRG